MRAVPLLAAAAVLPFTGCGGDDKPDEPKPADPVKVAVATTTAKGTAKSKLTIVPNHIDLGAGLKLQGAGSVSLREPRADLTFDLGDLLGIAGVLTGTDLPVQVDGETVYADPPDIPTVGIPDGWLKADVPGLAGALDPGKQMRQFAATGGFQEAGRETIDGVPVRRYHGKAGDLWVDDEHLVRRIRTIITLPGAAGPQPASPDVTTDLSAFGTPFTAKPPPDATDVTKTVEGILKTTGAGG